MPKITMPKIEVSDAPTTFRGNYVRTKISFELIRSQVACIRGSRQLRKMHIDSGDMELISNNAAMPEI